MKKSTLFILFLLLSAATCIFFLLQTQGEKQSVPNDYVAHTHTVLGVQTKNSDCVASGPLPDPACTPGAIFPEATKEQICVSGYSQTVRNVSTQLKKQVYEEYGIASHQPGEFEVDHYISLELGGSNDISNLWPEPASPKPGFHEKDEVENYLHDQVCAGKMSLQDAQSIISTNWLSVYNKIHP